MRVWLSIKKESIYVQKISKYVEEQKRLKVQDPANFKSVKKLMSRSKARMLK